MSTLYIPDIPQGEGNQILSRCINITVKTYHYQYQPVITQMFNIVLKNHYFTFNNEFYLKIQGKIGNALLPKLCKPFFMSKLEKTILNIKNFTKQTLLWLRFIDDILMIGQRNEKELTYSRNPHKRTYFYKNLEAEIQYFKPPK